MLKMTNIVDFEPLKLNNILSSQTSIMCHMSAEDSGGITMPPQLTEIKMHIAGYNFFKRCGALDRFPLTINMQ